MTSLRKTPPKIAFLGIALTVFALTTGTLLSGPTVAAADPPPEVEVETVEVLPSSAVPSVPASLNC